MSPLFRSLKVLALVGLVAVTAFPTLAQDVRFEPLGVVCGPAVMPRPCALDMSGDGEAILFANNTLWTATGGLQRIGGPPGTEMVAISDDGSTVIGNVPVAGDDGRIHKEAAIWLGGDRWKTLGGLPGARPCGRTLTSAYDVSGDGRVVVGLAYLDCRNAHAFSWSEETGMVDLGTIVEGRASRANAISADAFTIVGWSDAGDGSRLGARWEGGVGPEWFAGPGAPVFVGEAQGVSSDGRYVVGGGFADKSNPCSYHEAWFWSKETGVVSLGTPKGVCGDLVDGQAAARDVSDDGRVVVGYDYLFRLGEAWAFIWTAEDGMAMLQDWVRARTDEATAARICRGERSQLASCDEWDFLNSVAVSNDGKVIVGTGRNPDGMLEAFRIVVP